MNTRTRLRAAASLAALVGGALALTACASSPAASSTAEASAAPGVDPAKPTVVLVHGAWADASSFAPVASKLAADGYPVLEFANPLRSVSNDSASLAAFLEAKTDGDVVLVGHSYGGAVTSQAATDNPNVKALVYVNAFVPDQGESVGELLPAIPDADPLAGFDVVPYPGAPEGDAEVYLKSEVFPLAFSNGLPELVSTQLMAAQRPITLSALGEKAASVPAWKSLPSWYIAGTEDHSIPIDIQRTMAARAGSTVTELPTGHLSMLQNPKAVVQVIEDADAETR